MHRNRILHAALALAVLVAGSFLAMQTPPRIPERTVYRTPEPSHQVQPIKRAEPAQEAAGKAPESPVTGSNPVFAAFEAWVQSATVKKPSAGEEQQGVELAHARREALAQLIESDPKQALEKTVPAAARENLPAAVAAELEERIDARGDYTVAIASGPDMQSVVYRQVRVNGKTYNAHVYGRRSGQGTRMGIPLHGIAIGDRMALHESPIRVLEPGERPDPQKPVVNPDGKCPIKGVVSKKVTVDAGDILYFTCCSTCPDALSQQLIAAEGGSGSVAQGISGPAAAASWTQGNKTVLYINVKYSDSTNNYFGQAEVQSMADGCAAFMLENSYGTTSMTPTVTPLLTLPQTEAYYIANGYNALYADARTVATNAGYDYANYSLDAGCYVGGPGSFAGIASVGSRGVLLKSATPSTAAHEFGHNLGLWHANAWSTTDGTTIGAGSNFEYGDLFDTMGSGPLAAYNACHKNRLGWLPGANVTTVTTSGTYRITAFDQPVLTAGTSYALKITKDADRDYWVDFRQAITGNKWLMNGADLHWDPWASSNGGTSLLDATPGSPDGMNDSAIVIGHTFSDLVAGIHITPIGKGGTSPESLDVVVNVGSFAGNNAPTLSVSASPTAVDPNLPVTLTANASDADGDTLAYSWDFGDKTFGTNSPSVTKSWSGIGNYVVRCTVTDMKGGTASNWVIVSVGSPATISVNPTSLSQTLSPNQSATQTLNIGNIGGLPLAWALPAHVVSLTGGGDYSLALRDDGSVLAWGGNASGQLGDGTTSARLTAVPVTGLSGITKIAAGFFSNLAVSADGSVWAWGANGSGQLGDGTTTNRSTPVQVSGLTGVSAVACGIGHSLALKSDGTVWGWGSNGSGQLGDGTTTSRTSPVQVSGLSGIVSIACGFNHSLAIKSDGTVWAWGANGNGQLGVGTTTGHTTPVQVSGLTGVAAVACGANHSLALKADGTVWAWGRNNLGQLGNGSTTDRSTPSQVSGLTGVTAISGNCANHCLALEADATMRAWGNNGTGQLGDGTTTNRTTPVVVSGLSGITKIGTGSSHSLALKSDGTVRAWGANNNSQLGDGTSITRTTAVLVSGALTPLPAWLTVAPAAGTTAGDSSSAVTVTFNAAGLSEGVYSASLNVSSNDSGTPNVMVPVTLTVRNLSPVIQSAPWATPNPVTLPSTTVASVIASDPDNGPNPLTYTWSKVSGPGTVTFVPNGTTTSDSSTTTFGAAGVYVLRITVYDGGLSTTGDVTVTVNAPNQAPAITTQPANQTVTAGQTATFTVVASGTAPLTYQWKKNGANIAGA
ncbi:MAG: PKD domain-containing protein, partial [Planctomycetes bacterium]|nr:PKD domain-containing protein [Planctomycetota bacterium]